jgi:molybdopterin/thiamine biosynthesis adenylyltransferase
MQDVRPAIKPFVNIYKRQGDVYLGLGPEKTVLRNPTAAMQEFLLACDGTADLEELQCRYPDAAQWAQSLIAAEVMEDLDAEPHVTDPYLRRRMSRQINYLRLHDREGWSGWDGQLLLSRARVVVAGIGAGGTTLCRMLNTVGIGTIEVVDFDSYELDNLATHSTIDEADVGRLKTAALRDNLLRQNSRLNFVAHDARITSGDQLADIIDGADFFLSAFDYPRGQAVQWSNWASLVTGVPSASIGSTDKGGRAGPIVIPGATSCYACIGFSNGDDWLREADSQATTGTTVSLLAAIMVGEVVKVISGSTPSRLLGAWLYVNTATLRFDLTAQPPRPDCLCRDVGALRRGFDERSPAAGVA